MKKIMLILLLTATLLLAAVSAQAVCDNNLITNGDFESGNTGFTSDYDYVALTGSQTLWDEAKYAVGLDPTDYHYLWTSFKDHTTGEGNMMICNGQDPEGTAPQEAIVWSQDVTVVKGSTYEFSVWIAPSYPDAYPVLEVSINDNVIGTAVAPGGTNPGDWYQFTAQWISGIDGPVDIEIRDMLSVHTGNDFVIDDISLCFIKQEYSLCASQTMNVGHIDVSNDNDNLYVKYQITEPDVCLTETHLQAANDLESIPQTKKNNPIPGRFDYSMEHSCVTDYTYTIPLEGLTDDIFIAAHAAVRTLSSGATDACASGTFDSNQAKLKNGDPVSSARSAPENAWGAPDSNYPLQSFYSLGFGGSLSLTFPTFITGVLTVSEVTWGSYPSETAEVYVSRDGSDWAPLGVADNSASGDIRPSSFQLNECYQYVKIVDTTDSSLFESRQDADAFDVDAVCASLNCEEETAWGGCSEVDGEGFAGKNWATYFYYILQ
jgi:hypothetical protein